MTLKVHLLWRNTLNPTEHYLAARKQSSHLNLINDVKLAMDQNNIWLTDY